MFKKALHIQVVTRSGAVGASSNTGTVFGRGFNRVRVSGLWFKLAKMV